MKHTLNFVNGIYFFVYFMRSFKLLAIEFYSCYLNRVLFMA